MAKGTVDVNISIEKTIHMALTDILQRIWDEHGIRVNGVDVNWDDFSGMGNLNYRIRSIEVSSKTYAAWKSS